MKRISTLVIILAAAVMTVFGQTPADWAKLEKSVNFYVANDLGRNGYYDQKPIAELMGRMAETVGIECVAAPGDVHHFEGVRSTQDPLWMTNYELIYSHPELMLDWFPTCGNHEYRGNTQAVLDYSGVSARWNMPAKYYTKVLEDDGVTVRLVFIDTTPLIDKYRKDSAQYPDVQLVDPDAEVRWIDSVLRVSPEKWKIVVGHHPMYTYDDKDDIEQENMRARLEQIFQRNGVDAYFCGHIHTFQHIRTGKDSIDYVVNTSASKQRSPQRGPLTQYASENSGFGLLSFDEGVMHYTLVNSRGELEYEIERRK